MTHKFLFPVWLVIAALPGLGQDRLYPVTTTKGFPIVLTTDRFSFVVEKAFQHKLTLGYPSDGRFRPDTEAPLIVLWLRVQSLSPRPMELSTARFTCRDEEGRTCSALHRRKRQIESLRKTAARSAQERSAACRWDASA